MTGNKRRCRVRELIFHIGISLKGICLKLYLHMASGSSDGDVTKCFAWMSCGG